MKFEDKILFLYWKNIFPSFSYPPRSVTCTVPTATNTVSLGSLNYSFDYMTKSIFLDYSMIVSQKTCVIISQQNTYLASINIIHPQLETGHSGRKEMTM